MNSLSVERLSFERDDVPIFENVDFELNSGDIAQLVGPNGSGKTTLMRLIAGLSVPFSGVVKWNDTGVDSLEFKSSLLYIGHQIGVKQSMTPLENLRWYFGINGVKADGEIETSSSVSAKALNDALGKVGLSNFTDVPCYQLSAGQQRRVALARLYLSKAAVWILDEPFTAIDKQGVEDIQSIIDTHAKSGGIVVLTTHQLWKSENIRLIDLASFKPGYTQAYG